MSIDRELADSCWRSMLGEIPSESDLDMVVGTLESKEEFLAWLVTRRSLFSGYSDLLKDFQEAVQRHHLEPTTQRAQSGYPLEYEMARKTLNAVLGNVLVAESQVAASHDAAHEALLSLAATRGAGRLPDRWLMGFRKPA